MHCDAQWLYDKSEMHDTSDMLPIRIRFQSMKMCLRLSQDGNLQSIAGKSTRLLNQKGTLMGNPIHEEYDAPLICAEEFDPSKRTARSVTRLRLRIFQEPTTVSDVESDDSEVNMGKLKKGRRALSSPSDAT